MSSEERAPEIRAWLRDNMARETSRLLGQGYQAAVRLYETPHGRVVVKSPHPSMLLRALGRAAIRREHTVYERVRGVAGVPRSYGLIDGQHLVLEYIEGPSFRQYEPQLVARQRFFADLARTLDAMHAAGVAHGDLKRKDNLIVAAGERPCIVDLGIASLRPASGRGFAALRFEFVRHMDNNAWIKLKYQRRLDEIAPEDRARYRPLLIERVYRPLRIVWQKVSLRRPRQRWRRRRERDRR